MNNQSLVFMLAYSLVLILAVFLLRNKFPNRYSIGLALCFLAPAWGQFYLKAKSDWIFWVVFWAIERGITSSLKDNSDYSIMPWLIIGALSASVMGYRISSAKENEFPQSEHPTN